MTTIDMSTMVWLAGALLFAGVATGILAGLFGVGGGAIIVPILYDVFGFLDISDDVRMPLAVGTSLAIIVPTSLRSARGHYRKGAMDIAILRTWALPVLAGVCVGTWVARYAPPEVFQAAFILFGTAISTKMLFGRDSWRIADALPTGMALKLYGAGMGLMSALMGVGGGAMSTLVMTLHGRPIHQSVATSSGLGVLISIPGAIGYIISGWGRPGLPPDAFGFVSLLGFALIFPTALITTQIGVNLAHAVKRRTLEILFGIFLIFVCLRFLVAMLT